MFPISCPFIQQEASWLGSLLLLGACLGALVSSWVIGLGRRRAVCASAFPRFVGWIMISAASDVYMMYGGRYVRNELLIINFSLSFIFVTSCSCLFKWNVSICYR